MELGKVRVQDWSLTCAQNGVSGTKHMGPTHRVADHSNVLSTHIFLSK